MTISRRALLAAGRAPDCSPPASPTPDTRIGQDRDTWTVQVALSSFTTSQVVKLHELFVAATVSILSSLVVFLCFQRWIAEGVERSGIDWRGLHRAPAGRDESRDEGKACRRQSTVTGWRTTASNR